MTNYILKTQVKQCLNNVSNQGFRKEYIWKNIIDINCYIDKHNSVILDYNDLTQYIINKHLNNKMDRKYIPSDSRVTTIIIFLLNELKKSMRIYKNDLRKIVKSMNQ
jgi:hypothetical protein